MSERCKQCRSRNFIDEHGDGSNLICTRCGTVNFYEFAPEEDELIEMMSSKSHISKEAKRQQEEEALKQKYLKEALKLEREAQVLFKEAQKKRDLCDSLGSMSMSHKKLKRPGVSVPRGKINKKTMIGSMPHSQRNVIAISSYNPPNLSDLSDLSISSPHPFI